MKYQALSSGYSQNARRKAIIKTIKRMSTAGLSPVRSGNISMRLDKGMLITPTGLCAEEMQPDDVVYCTLKGKTDPNSLKPSSEWLFHARLYKKRPEINAIVHCHSRFATILAAAHKPIPAFHYMVAVAGNKSIPLVPYAIFGSKKLANQVVKFLHKVNAGLLANHGQITVGSSLQSAWELAVEVEELAAQYYHVLQMDAVHLLSDKQMDKVLKKFSTYGQNAI